MPCLPLSIRFGEESYCSYRNKSSFQEGGTWGALTESCWMAKTFYTCLFKGVGLLSNQWLFVQKGTDHGQQCRPWLRPSAQKVPVGQDLGQVEVQWCLHPEGGCWLGWLAQGQTEPWAGIPLTSQQQVNLLSLEWEVRAGQTGKHYTLQVLLGKQQFSLFSRNFLPPSPIFPWFS